MNILSYEESRDDQARINEEELIFGLIGSSVGHEDGPPVMVDVGANFGNSLDIYLSRGWKVHAFEPDPDNRSKLLSIYGGNELLSVSADAVSLIDGERLSFYASDESTGISSLSAFTEGHREKTTVTTTRLDSYLRDKKLSRVDFLKVDVEGHDYFALQTFPFDRFQPAAVIVEYEDKKSLPLGYDVHEMATFLEVAGYHVWVSEWHPIVRYGIAHDWRRLVRYQGQLELSSGWGNLIGFKDNFGDEEIAREVALRVRYGQNTVHGVSVIPKSPGKNGPRLVRIAKFLVRQFGKISEKKAAGLYVKLRGLRRRLRTMI